MRYILLGATGDLARKKIVPAIARLYTEGALPQDFTLLSSSRRSWSDEEYRSFIRPELLKAGIQEKDVETFLPRITYVEVDFEARPSLGQLASVLGEGDVIHLAIRPDSHASVIRALGEAHELGLRGMHFVIEKPFGDDEHSARELDELLTRYLHEGQIYRIDHYLGKEGVRALPEESRANKLEEFFMAGRVRQITVTLFETQGIEGRGAFYDPVGVLKDVVQNHALEALSMLLAENELSLPEARAAALARLSFGGHVRQGQYRGYRSESDVATDSKTPTAIEIEGVYRHPAGEVPVRIRAAKAMSENRSDIRVTTDDGEISFSLLGSRAYEHLIQEVISGKCDYFPNMDEIILAWKLVDPIATRLPSLPLVEYEKGTKEF